MAPRALDEIFALFNFVNERAGALALRTIRASPYHNPPKKIHFYAKEPPRRATYPRRLWDEKSTILNI